MSKVADGTACDGSLPTSRSPLPRTITAKDRLGGWQDSKIRKQIYQGRQTDELPAEAAKVRRALRLGAQLVDAAKDSAYANGSHPPAKDRVATSAWKGSGMGPADGRA